MVGVAIRFIVGKISDEEVRDLVKNQSIIAKLILSPDDYELFHYQQGHLIEVETEHGNRRWCKIDNMETISDDERVIIIFTLKQHAVD